MVLQTHEKKLFSVSQIYSVLVYTKKNTHMVQAAAFKPH